MSHRVVTALGHRDGQRDGLGTPEGARVRSHSDSPRDGRDICHIPTARGVIALSVPCPTVTSWGMRVTSVPCPWCQPVG